jgi:hypothetical protein
MMVNSIPANTTPVIPTGNAMVAVLVARTALLDMLEKRYVRQMKKFKVPSILSFREFDDDTLYAEGMNMVKFEILVIDSAIDLYSWNTDWSTPNAIAIDRRVLNTLGCTDKILIRKLRSGPLLECNPLEVYDERTGKMLLIFRYEPGRHVQYH